MKTKNLLMVVLMLVGITITSCKKPQKGDTGPVGPAGAPGPQAKTFNFTLTFNPGDTFKSYGGITGFTADDVVLVYVVYETIGTTRYWSQLPVVVSGYVNFIPEFSEDTGFLFINTLKTDGTTGSPWTSSSTLDFKAVLISSSQMKTHPNVNFNNYEAVKTAFNLKE